MVCLCVFVCVFMCVRMRMPKEMRCCQSCVLTQTVNLKDEDCFCKNCYC